MFKGHEKFYSDNGKRLVLVADDEWINREILGNLLKDDYEVLFASDGMETLSMIRENKDMLSLVLLDLLMPNMNGLELLKQLKQEEQKIQKIPVIVLTSDQKSEVESLTLGAVDFIPKPYPQASVILARVLRTIELSEDRQILSSTERDPLTNLYNREFFYRYAEQFDQHHKDLEMDAIVIDIYHFHIINERFGTVYGDSVLRSIAEKTKEAVNDLGGIVCRREADTFMIYCPHTDNYGEILEKATGGISEEDITNNRIRLRMGVYANVDKTLDIERRFDRAKMAADALRNNYSKSIEEYDNDLHEKEIYAEQLIEDFRAAIEKKQFKVYYQPKFDLRTGTPTLASAEALVRWQHPKFGVISPGIFIPLYENNGLIQELDNYVWRSTAAQIKEWKERFGITVPVSVNVSRVDMYDPHLIDNFLGILKENSLSPEELLLEITESAYTQDSDQIIETVSGLRSLGFMIEMDDFGTGYSSLNMISALPIDALKLDMQFIRNAFSKGKDTRMLEVIIDIANYLSVPVIAEGVETKEQLEALKALGCDYVQGYYFSKPVPAELFEQFITEKKEQERAGLPQSGKSPKPARRENSLEKISLALSGTFEKIYYIDISNDHYIVFSPEARNEVFNVKTGGNDFFDEACKEIERLVFAEDREKISEYMRKDVLLRKLEDQLFAAVTYRLCDGGETKRYNLKAVKVHVRDNHHIAIGVGRIDDV